MFDRVLTEHAAAIKMYVEYSNTVYDKLDNEWQ